MFKKFYGETGRNYLLTFATEFVVLLAGVLVYKLAAKNLGENGFSEYAICRRTISFIQPLLIIGLGVGIPRYIAFATTDNTFKESGSYFASGFLIVQIITVIFITVFNFFSKQFSFFIFGSESFFFLVPYLSLMLAGMVMHSIAYGYLRGKIRMNAANLLQLINMGIIPMVAFIFTADIVKILLYTGTAWIITSFSVVLIIFLNDGWKKENLLLCGKNLLQYGIQRVPGDVALAGFLALPAYFTAHLVLDNLKTAGYTAFGMSLLNMVGAVFGPICLLLLPQASKAIAAKDFSTLKIFSKRITVLTLTLTMAGLIIVEVCTEPLLEIYLGKVTRELIVIVRIIMLACVGYSIYIALRSILDAYYVKAVNTKNIFISFILFIIPSSLIVWKEYNYSFILYFFTAAMSLLGLLTYFETKKIFNFIK